MDSSPIPFVLREFERTGSQAPRFTIAGFRGWAYCSDVYDGDTCQLSFLPLGMQEPARWTCRLARIETAEIGRRAKSTQEQEAAVKGRAKLQELILDNIVYIHVTSMGKYKRPVVEIFTKDGQNVNDILVQSGIAVPYGTRPLPWNA